MTRRPLDSEERWRKEIGELTGTPPWLVNDPQRVARWRARRNRQLMLFLLAVAANAAFVAYFGRGHDQEYVGGLMMLALLFSAYFVPIVGGLLYMIVMSLWNWWTVPPSPERQTWRDD